MYYYGGADDWFLGTWGILEVRSCNDRGVAGGLIPLPDNDDVARIKCELPKASPTGPGQPCPNTAPVKRFAVAAINIDITYNNAGDHDPRGLMYALEADVPALRNGTKQPEPLVIRANAGDCVEVTLTNRLDPAKMTPHCFEALEPGQLGFREGVLSFPACIDQPPRNEVNVPGFKPFPVSARVSMRPQLVDSAAASLGTNVWGEVSVWGSSQRDGTVGPGQSIQYRWFLPPGLTGMALLGDRGDVQNHLHHGLYGALVIEPAGSSYLNPRTGQPLASGTQAVIANPHQPDFRENIVMFNSDLSLFRRDTNGILPTTSRCRTTSTWCWARAGRRTTRRTRASSR